MADYPGSIPSIADDKTNATTTEDDHPDHHNQLADELVAGLTTLGVNPQGSETDVADRLDAIEAALGGGWRAATEGEYDDYFDADNSSDWTTVAPDTGAASWRYNYEGRFGMWRGLNVVGDNLNSTDFAAYLKPMSIGTNDYIQTTISLGAHTPTINNFGLVFTDGTTTSANLAGFGIRTNATVTALVSFHGTLTNGSYGGLNENILHMPGGIPTHYRLTMNSTTSWKGQVSFDGVNWTDHADGSGNFSTTVTPTHAGFVLGSVGSGMTSAQRTLWHASYFHSNATS